MQIKVAEHAGFCFGVERAVSLVEQLMEEEVSPLYTYGPIIHNETVVEDLAVRGVKVIGGPEELGLSAPGTVVIRSHGVSEEEERQIRVAGHTIADATCPFVKKIHLQVREAGRGGRTVFITGDPGHAEVKAILGWCEGEAFVLREAEDMPLLDPETPITLLSQTTYNLKKFEKTVEIARKRYYNLIAVNTICNATQIRQQETEALAQSADAMIVIGGSGSSNTRKLVEICEAHCSRTYYIRTLKDLAEQQFQPVRFVGITAGASTPKNIIEEVQNFVGSEF